MYRTVRNVTNIDRPSFIVELLNGTEFSSAEKARHFFFFLRTVLNKHASLSVRKVTNHISPWIELIRD